MAAAKTKGVIIADASEAQAKKSSPIFKKLMKTRMGSMGHGMSSMREDVYKGHDIMVMTSYEVRIDGKLFKGELGVSNAGHVHYHGLPNVAFTSALDLVRCIIDQFPDEFPPKKRGGKGKGGTMPGMSMKGGK